MKKNIKKGLILSSCMLMCLSAVGCGSSKDQKSDKKNVETSENIMDVRTAKIINQQQAILQFTTANKAGSVISVELVPSKDSYIYTLDAVDKKGIEHIYTIDAKSGNISKKEEKGPIDKANPPEYIDFVPVLDIQKAGKAAIQIANNPDLNQVLAYKLYSDGGKNIYQITLTDGGEGDSAKNEKVLIDGISGKKLTEEEIKNAENTKKEEDAKKAAEKQKAAEASQKKNTTPSVE
nr:PepSY domain-containing protein [uncultured Peptostreptococcus sp.]